MSDYAVEDCSQAPPLLIFCSFVAISQHFDSLDSAYKQKKSFLRHYLDSSQSFHGLKSSLLRHSIHDLNLSLQF